MKTMKTIKIIIILFTSTLCFGQTIDNISLLSTYSTTNSVNVLGYHNPNDGGGGLFYRVNSSTLEDKGIIFNSNIIGEKWIRNIVDDKVNVKWFGAKGDSIQNDKPSINNALNYCRKAKGSVLYFPAGKYFIDNSIYFNDIRDDGLKILGSGRNSKIFKGANGNGMFRIIGPRTGIEIKNLSFQSDLDVLGVTIQGDAKNIILDKLFFSGKFTAAIQLSRCENIQIINSEFKSISGYQILQQEGFSSNEILVHRNIATNCGRDFIELNSEVGAPSKNWVISNNTVRNVKCLDSSLDCRFLGITSTNGVIVSNNIFEKCSGDAAFHFEKISGNITITNNIIRDPNGQYGSLISNYDNYSNAKRYINFSDNLVEFSSSYNLSGASLLIYSRNEDKTVFNITNNKFVNNSSEELNLLYKSESKTHWNFIGNDVFGFNNVISIGKNAGHININNNTFNDSKSAIILDSNSSIGSNSINIQNNTFQNIENVFASSGKEINLLSFSSNIFDNSTLNFGLDAVFLKNFKNNTFKNNSITNYRTSQISLDIPNNISKNIFSIEKQNYTYLCWVEIQASSAANRTRHLLRVSRNLIWGSNFNNHVSVIDQTRNGNYPLPIFDVNENGLIVKITGSSGSSFKAKVSIIDINGLLILNEESLGNKLAKTNVFVKESLIENTNPLVFENSVSFDEFSKLYPNPAKNEFFIQTDQVGVINDLSIYDLNGRLIKRLNNIKSNEAINITDLSIGTYLAIIYINNKKEIRKIIKK
jgi:hypothetical protein